MEGLQKQALRSRTKQGAFILFRQQKQYICEELTEQRNLDLGCSMSKESKPILDLSSKIKKYQRLFIQASLWAS